MYDEKAENLCLLQSRIPILCMMKKKTYVCRGVEYIKFWEEEGWEDGEKLWSVKKFGIRKDLLVDLVFVPST